MSSIPELIAEVAVAAADMVAAAEVDPLDGDWLDPAGGASFGWRVTLPNGNTVDLCAPDEEAARAAVVPHVERDLRERSGVEDPRVDRVADLAAAIAAAKTPEEGFAAMKGWASEVSPP